MHKTVPDLLPPSRAAKGHGIVVAGGAGEACKKHFGGGIGSLAIDPNIVGDAHFRGDSIKPFWVGDIDPKGSFIHVLDDGSLDIILRELDTVTDLAQYLEKKVAFIRSGRLHAAAGEEDLLAYYAVRMNGDEHDFIHPEDRPWKDGERVLIDQTHYRSLISDPQFLAKKEADRNSYLWDALIRNFTTHMLAGTSVIPEGEEYDLKKSELAVREMALQSRLERRGHGDAILDALQVSKGREIFIRVLVPEVHARREAGFFLLIIAYHKMFDAKGGYDEYRRARAAYGELYAKGILLRYPHLDRVVGVIIEPPESRLSSADDILYVGRQEEWTDEHKDQILTACRNLGIMRDDFVERQFGTPEFPDIAVHQASMKRKSQGNRRQRRAQQSRMRKDRKTSW